jgi:hypothetical protein
MIDEEEGFVYSRGMGERTYLEMLDRNQQTFEGNMTQREDALGRKRNVKCEIDIAEQLKGKAKKRWVKLFGSDKKADRKAEEGDINE